MKVLVVDDTGLIGKAIVKAIKKLDHEVVIAGHSSGDVQVDLTSTSSIQDMYQKVGLLNAVVSAPASSIAFKSVTEMSKDDYLQGIQNKLLGQIDLVLQGLKYLHPGGSFTLTSGILNHSFIPKGSCAACVNSALEGFVQNASLELPHGLRLNVVSPDLIEEAKDKYKDFFIGFPGTPVALVAQAYIRVVFGILNGQIMKIW